MDQIKIGKFIAERRKAAGLTQMQLAEKLDITDRAVSKWETGRAMPDSSLMLDLCDLLNITVNDLLSGEIVTMENYTREMEKKLLELVQEKEHKDRQMLTLEWVIGILSVIILLVPAGIAAYLPMAEWKATLLVFAGLIPCLIGLHFAIKIEQTAGYYVCKHCGHRYVPTLSAVYAAPHFGRTRYMRCPACQKKSWQKKVISKND